MKKLSRIAALLAAGAALLMVGAGFVSCSEDDGGEDNSPKLTISADSAVSVEAGEAINVVITAALKNDSFNGSIGKGDDLDGFVTVIPSSLTSFEDNLSIIADEAIADGATSAKVRLTVTTTAEAVSGTIKVTIDGAALKSGKALASNSLSYTIAGENGGGDSTVATAATYSFKGGTNGIVLADLNGWDMATKDVIGSPIASEMTSKTLSNGATLHWKGSKVGTLRFRSTHDAGAELTADIVAAATALNYNGGYNGDMTDGVSLDSVDRYVEIPVDGAGTVSASVTFKGAKESDSPTGGPFQAAFVDSEGALLGNLVTDEVTASSSKTVSATVSEAKSVYLVFSRNGATKGGNGTGGMDVTSIVVAPAAN